MLDKITSKIKKILSWCWKTRLRKLVSSFLIAVVIILPLYSFFFSKETSAAWWNDTWMYRKSIAIANSSSAQTNTQVKILDNYDLSALVSGGNIQADLDDLRFTDINGNLIKYWIEDSTNSSVDIWGFLPSVPASGATVYMYYGNPNATAGKSTVGTSDYPGVSCKAILLSGVSSSGTYYIDPTAQESSDKFQAYCDLTTDSGGWTMFEKAVVGTNTVVSTIGELNVSELASGTHNGVNAKMSDASIRTMLSGNGVGNGEILFINSDLSNRYVKLRFSQTMINGWSSSKRYDTAPRNFDFYHYSNSTWYDINGHFNNKNFSTYDDGGAWSGQMAEDNTGTEVYWHFHTQSNDVASANFMFMLKESAISTSGHTVVSGTPAAEEKGTGPIAYWSFDEGYETTANDSTSNNNDGTLTNMSSTPSPTSGWQTEDKCVAGKCLAFDGSNDYVLSSNYFNLKPATLSFWFKNTGDWSSYPIIISKDSGGASGYIQYYSGQLSFYAPGNTVTVNWGTPSLNTWHHLELVVTGTQHIAYLDGVMVGSPVNSTLDLFTGNYNFQIGRYDAGSYYFKGAVDEIKIYSYARSAAQIKMDYNVGQTGSGGAEGAETTIGAKSQKWMTDGLVGHWKMDEASWSGAAGEVIDASGNSKNGTATNGATVAAGKFGNGGSFDGSNDYVNIGSLGSFPTQGSLSFWMNASEMANYRNPIGTGAGNAGIRFEENSSGTFGVVTGNDAGTYDSSAYFSSGMQTNTWYHITYIWDTSTNTETGYLNGSQVFSTSHSLWPTALPSFRIGKGFTDDAARHWNGKVDETRIYNRALSPKEVSDLYNYAPGPVGYWKMDDASGATAVDASGNGYNGTLGSTAAWSTGKFGQAAEFNHTGTSNVSVPILNMKYQVTASAWVYLDSVTSDVYDAILSNYYNAGAQCYGIATNNFVMRFDTAGSKGISITTPSLRTWHYYTLTYDGSTMRGYIDGVPSGTPVTVTNDTITQCGAYEYIGMLHAGAAGLDGKVDDVKIYNYARSSKQIVEDMNAGHPAGGSPVGSQVGYWKFDEGQGITANDSSPQRNNGTLTGATHVPTWSNNGKFGKAINFDGVDDYVNIADASSIKPTGNFSMTMWFNSTVTGKGFFQSWSQNTNLAGIRLWINAGNFRFDIGKNTGGSMDTDWKMLEYSATSYLDGNWHSIGAIYDGVKMYIYLDGILKTSVDWTGNPGYAANNYPRIGMLNNAGVELTALAFSGKLDEVKLYNYALTADEIKLDMNQGKSLQLSSVGTDASGNPSNSSDRAYCPPGDTTASCGPIAEWKLDEGTSTTANDTSGNGNVGTLTNGPTWVPGKYGNAARFDGNNDSFSATQNISSSYTVSMWINSEGNSATHIWEGQDLSAPSLEGSDSGYTFYMNNANSISTGAITPNQWYHVLASYDGPSQTQKLYVNGMLKGTNTSVASDNITTLYLASRGGTSRYWKGKIDDVKIYDYARTPAQIAWDYNRGKPVGWWRMDEGEGATVYDHSASGLEGNGNTGTMTNMDPSNDWVTGKINKALDFDGGNDYVKTSGFTGLSSGGQVTMSAWIKPTMDNSQNIILDRATILRLEISDSNVPNADIGTGSAWCNTSISGGTLTSGQWAHLVVTYDNVSARMYLDGKLVNTQTFSCTMGNSGDFYIGQYTGGSYNFPGQIDDVRVYNYALTAQQVKDVMNNGAVNYR